MYNRIVLNRLPQNDEHQIQDEESLPGPAVGERQGNEIAGQVVRFGNWVHGYLLTKNELYLD